MRTTYVIAIALLLAGCHATVPRSQLFRDYKDKSPAFVLDPDLERKLVYCSFDQHITSIGNMDWTHMDIGLVLLITLETYSFVDQIDSIMHHTFIVVRPPATKWIDARVYMPDPDFFILDVNWKGLGGDQLMPMLYDAEQPVREFLEGKDKGVDKEG
jgi:hypothetical protein